MLLLLAVPANGFPTAAFLSAGVWLLFSPPPFFSLLLVAPFLVSSPSLGPCFPQCWLVISPATSLHSLGAYRMIPGQPFSFLQYAWRQCSTGGQHKLRKNFRLVGLTDNYSSLVCLLYTMFGGAWRDHEFEAVERLGENLQLLVMILGWDVEASQARRSSFSEKT